MSENREFPQFNLDTMSGVYPGSRTPVMQRIRLLPLGGDDRSPCWGRLLWYADPPSCVLQLQSEVSGQWQEAPVLRLENPLDGDFAYTLRQALAAAGWRIFICGHCRHWQPVLNTNNADGIPLGRCRWGTIASDALKMPEAQRYQSVLAPGCPAWQDAGEQAESPLALPAVEEVQSENLPKLGLWKRIKTRLSGERPTPQRPSWGEKIVERSGVGAGTEPCHACQGRIANLGALTVATDEDDKRTFSVWRCRRCHTFYLNDWIDRWERLDSLETEETYYRLAPVEAVELLGLFDGVIGGEHPAGRHERVELHAWIRSFIQNRPRLSHQIRQGR